MCIITMVAAALLEGVPDIIAKLAGLKAMGMGGRFGSRKSSMIFFAAMQTGVSITDRVLPERR